MELRLVKFFDKGDNAASGVVRFYLPLKLGFRISKHKCFRFCIDFQFSLKVGKLFAMSYVKVMRHVFSICFVCALPLCLSVTLCLLLSLSPSYIYLWKIFNLKTVFKTIAKLKRIKVTFISEPAGRICRGAKVFWRTKRVSLQSEIWEGTVRQ